MPRRSDVLNAQEAANFLGAHVETIRRLARRHEIPAYKLGKNWRFNKSAIRRWASTHHIRTRQPAILVVSDDEVFWNEVSLMLESEGYRVLRASEANQAVDLAQRERLNLLFLDVKFQDTGSGSILTKLRQICPALPVVAMAANPDTELMAEALRCPPVTLLPKPSAKKLVLDTVHLFVTGARYWE